MIVTRPNTRIGGFDLIEVDKRALRPYLEGYATIDQHWIGWENHGASIPMLASAKLNGEPVPTLCLPRIAWLLHGLRRIGDKQVELPFGTLELEWTEEFISHAPAREDVAYICMFSPSLWAMPLVRAQQDHDLEELVDVCSTGMHPAVYIEVDVPGCARLVDARHMHAWLTPGNLYVAVVLDRWSVSVELVGAIEAVFEYGDHHGGKFAGIYRAEPQEDWRINIRALNHKGRDPRYYALQGNGSIVSDRSEEYRRSLAQRI